LFVSTANFNPKRKRRIRLEALGIQKGYSSRLEMKGTEKQNQIPNVF